MAQRDTMIPVCKIITMGPAHLYSDIPLTNTGVSYQDIRYGTEPSCMPNQVMPVIVSATSSLVGKVDLGLLANWTSGTANVHIRQGAIERIEVDNPGLFDWTLAAVNDPVVVTPEAQLSSISLGPRTIQYKNSIGTVITSSSPTWQKLSGNIASGVDGAKTYFGVSAGGGQDSSAVVEMTYNQAGGVFTTRILSPGVWAKNGGTANTRTGFNYQVGGGITTDTLLDSLSGTFTPLADLNGGMFDLSSSFYEEVSSFGGDASAGFFMVSSYVSNPFAAGFSNPMASPNYVTVTDLSGTDGFFWVKPSLGGAYASGTPAGVAVSSLAGWANPTSSGIPGVFAAAGSTAVLSVADGISHIDIMNSMDTSTCFAINYGVIKQSNTIGDGLHPDVR